MLGPSTAVSVRAFIVTAEKRRTSGSGCPSRRLLDAGSSSVAAAGCCRRAICGSGEISVKCLLYSRVLLPPFPSSWVSRGSDHSVCSHAARWIQRAVLADRAAPAPAAVGPVQRTAGDEAYLLKLPHHPSIAMADDQQQPGQKPAPGLGSLPALVPGLQGPEANALQFKIKNSIW